MTTALVIGGEYYGRVPKNVPDGFSGSAWRAACGQRRFLATSLARLTKEHAITKIIHGGDPGAGILAHGWATKRDIAQEQVPLDRGLSKIEAMRRRNAAMIERRPDLVIAFQGGRTTRDAIKRALAAGITVLDLRGCK